MLNKPNIIKEEVYPLIKNESINNADEPPVKPVKSGGRKRK